MKMGRGRVEENVVYVYHLLFPEIEIGLVIRVLSQVFQVQTFEDFGGSQGWDRSVSNTVSVPFQFPKIVFWSTLGAKLDRRIPRLT